MKKNIIQTTKIIILGLTLCAGFALAQTWGGPGANPPGANISAPINDSGSYQLKSGGLAVGSATATTSQLVVVGNSIFNGNVSIMPTTTSIQICSHFGGCHTLFSVQPSNLYVGEADAGFSSSHPLSGVLSNLNQMSVAQYGSSATISQTAELLNIDGGSLKTTSLVHSASPYNLREVCSDSSGMMILCDIPIPTPTPAISHGSQTYIPGATSGTLGTSNPTKFIVPVGVTSITIQVWGGGGMGCAGSGGTTACYGGGGGGGSAGVHDSRTLSVTSGQISWGQSFQVLVGKGGNTYGVYFDQAHQGLQATSYPGQGQPTIFGSVVSAIGGNSTVACRSADGVGTTGGAGGIGGGPSGGNGTNGSCWSVSHGSGTSGVGGGGGDAGAPGSIGDGGHGGNGSGSGGWNKGTTGNDGAIVVTW